MGRAIAVTNQKGGVGKTTTAVNLAACLAEQKKKVLAIDMDPQGNMTSGFGIVKEDLDGTLYELIMGGKRFRDVLVTLNKHLDLLPANVELSATEIELVGVDNKEYIVRDEIKEFRGKYDYIIIDCPPSLNMLTINAMTTANSILIPIQCEFYALEGLSQLLHTVDLVKERLNPSLEVEGVVFTMYDARTNLSLQVVENVKENLDCRVYQTIIPRNVRLAEAPSHGQPINEYESKSVGAESYRALTKEIMEKK